MRFIELFSVPLQPKGCERLRVGDQRSGMTAPAVLALEISLKYVFIMATMTLPQTSQIIVTLEDNALVADIKRALKMIRGIASVRTATISDDHTITPAMRRSINKARREYAKGETIKCSTPEEMQRYFDSL